MNRLWIRLSLAFGFVILLNFAIFGLTVRRAAEGTLLQDTFATILAQNNGPVTELSAYYAAHSSWDGISAYFNERPNYFVVGPVGAIRLSLVDVNGKILVGHTSRPPLTPAELETKAIAIRSQQQIVGYVLIERTELPSNAEPWPMLALTNEVTRLFLVALAAVSLISIMAGGWMSLSLTAPLRRLALSAQTIGQKKQITTLKVQGTAEVRELARAINEMLHQLDVAETHRRNLVADVAHELRTPLTVLRGNLQAILLDDVIPLSKGEMSQLYDQTTLLSRLVNDLHELSQAEADKLPMHMEAVNVNTLIIDQVEMFSALADQENIHMVAEPSPQRVMVTGDAMRLAQVISNLVTNALNHTPSGGTIIARSVTVGGKVEISIQDTGVGIPPNHLDHIFDRFYRADASRSRVKGGAGLGLAITKAIVEAHGGAVRVASLGIVGQGSTFTIELPRRVEAL